MLSGVTRETRVLWSNLCLTGGIMLKLCRTKMKLTLTNIFSLSFLKELLDNNDSVKHLISKRKVGNCEALKGLPYVFLQWTCIWWKVSNVVFSYLEIVVDKLFLVKDSRQTCLSVCLLVTNYNVSGDLLLYMIIALTCTSFHNMFMNCDKNELDIDNIHTSVCLNGISINLP